MTPQQILGRQEKLVTEMSELVRRMREALISVEKVPPSQNRLPIEPVLVGTRWSDRVARGSVGILVRYAKYSVELTYAELHQELVKAGAEANIGMMQKYAGPLDRICLAFAALGKRTGQVVPPLTVLVVNGRSRQPSHGMNSRLADWLRGIQRQDLASAVDAVAPRNSAPPEIVDFAKKAVFDFPNWETAVAGVGLTGEPAEDMARAL